MAIYVTGDVHAYLSPIWNDQDILIIAGDFGVGFWDGYYFDYAIRAKGYDWWTIELCNN